MIAPPERGGERVAVVLRAGGVAGLCTAVPALRALRRGLPHRLVLAAPSRLAPLIALAEVADEIAPTEDLDRPLDPRLVGAELTVDLHGPDARSMARLDDLAAPRRIAFHRDREPTWREGEPERDRWCRLVREGMGLAADPLDLRIAAPRPWVRASRGVVVHAGAGSAARRWPIERFAAVVRHLVAAGLEVTLTGTPADRERADAIVGALPDLAGEHVTDLTGRTDLTGLCRAVATAQLVICGETGVGHLATAFERPSIQLFGPTDPRTWGPPADGRHRVLWAGRSGDPDAPTVGPGLLELSVVDVLEAVDAQLAADSPWTWAAWVV